jgi:isoleucyl-tRNA synthetase
MLGNISDFDPAKDAVAYGELEEIDRYSLHRLEEIVGQVTRCYESYEFYKVYHAAHNYCAVDLSSLYLDILKDRLYASARDSRLRRSAQTALYEITSTLARLLAPILAHTAEEVWQQLDGAGKAESVHLSRFPEPRPERIDQELAQRWATILELRDRVMLKLEEARQSGKIGKPLESRVRLVLERELHDELKPYEAQLPSIFIVSQVELTASEKEDISVEAPLGRKCDRCWLVLESVGGHPEHPGLCDRCFEAIG